MNSLTKRQFQAAVNNAVARRMAASLSVLPARRRRNARRQPRKSRRLAVRTSPRNYTRALPAAYAAHVRPRFNVVSRSATSAIVSGCDLVYPIPATLAPNADVIFAMFPANPAYWMGTRISQFAPAYQNYRPISFKVSYIPQVAVTQQGTVFMGTLWNEAAPVNNIQQSLFTSNGGCLTQCYVPADTTIQLGRNLQQNLFTMNDALNPDTCPFMFLAGVRGADVVPGYFYVTYSYEFRNPIGSAWAFNTSGLTTIGNLQNLPTYANMTFVLAEQAGGFGPGTQLDLEYNGRIFYHGSEITLDQSVSGVLYSNQQATITTNNLASYFTITGITYGATTVPVPLLNTASGSTVSLPSGSAILRLHDTGAGITAYWLVNNGGGTAGVTTQDGDLYYVFTSVGSVVNINTAAGTSFDLNDDVTNNVAGVTVTLPPEYTFPKTA